MLPDSSATLHYPGAVILQHSHPFHLGPLTLRCAYHIDLLMRLLAPHQSVRC